MNYLYIYMCICCIINMLFSMINLALSITLCFINVDNLSWIYLIIMLKNMLDIIFDIFMLITHNENYITIKYAVFSTILCLGFVCNLLFFLLNVFSSIFFVFLMFIFFNISFFINFILCVFIVYDCFIKSETDENTLNLTENYKYYYEDN